MFIDFVEQGLSIPLRDWMILSQGVLGAKCVGKYLEQDKGYFVT